MVKTYDSDWGDDFDARFGDPKVALKCDCCECDIYAGDKYYQVDGKPMCEDCVRENAFDILTENYLESLEAVSVSGREENDDNDLL